ncbi:hypothetical protein FQN50_009866 [Emmonsiellopsis sp. PD_5]|nr:hypothetical protein FQN50_009866 [Emmonsiellopsis sp. PD_5]
MPPGLLSVTMHPHPSLPLPSFHDWYNNEHGPTRLRLPFIPNGLRFRTLDTLPNPNPNPNPNDESTLLPPAYLAIYDITDMAELTRPAYQRLRRDDVKSSREKETMAQIDIDRRLYDFVEQWVAPGYISLDELSQDGAGRVLVAISQTLHPGAANEVEFNTWYRDEHMVLLSKVPGWLRTRRFVTSSIDSNKAGGIEYLSLHEYSTATVPNSPEIHSANRTPWREKVMTNIVASRTRRVYEHFYTFGGAPRDLASLADPSSPSSPFSSPDGLTKALPPTPTSSSPSPFPAIESYITTPDGVRLPYRLEGSTDPHAPLIVLSNSILTHYSIWDEFVAKFLANPANSGYRVLRYLTRGRFADCGGSEEEITVDVLARDIIALLDTLRVGKAAALVGVSLGGATVLNAALKWPGRVGAFVACDTNSKSPEGNRKAWGERIAMARNEGESVVSSSPFAKEAGQLEAVVGSQLAEVTVRRWFVPESYDGGVMEEKAKRVTQWVRENSFEGFERSVNALFEYDLREAMGRVDKGVKGAFLVGAGDGVLPKTMKEMVGQMGGAGAEYFVIEGAGHLPMVEKPAEFERVVSGFLRGVKN